ncbi:MAG: hypothetical protein JWN93_2223 [Hyphomicrobiales bacterium]|nr:hypothetical protein [Hyphomicrobiales bacterium]
MHAVRIVLLLIALVGAIVAGWVFVDQAIQPETAPEVRLPAEGDLSAVGLRAVDERLRLAPEYAPFFARLKSAFPQDHEKAMQVFAERAVQTSRLDEPDTYLVEAVRMLRRSHGVLASKAGAGELDRVFLMQARVMGGLAEVDPRLCVDFLYGNAAQGFFNFAARNRALMADMAMAGLDAIASGRAQKVERAPPSDADFAALEKALEAKGLGRNEIDALLDGKTPEPPIPDAAMCRAGRAYLDALRAIPEDARMRIYALAVELLARS